MTTAFNPIQKAQDAFAMFWLNLFPPRPLIETIEADQDNITLDYLTAMPTQSRLLLAHFVERSDPDMTLLAGDTDVCNPLFAGWLTSIPCSTIGAISFRFKPYVWNQLMSLRSEFLDGDLSELKNYRKRKSATYPWIW